MTNTLSPRLSRAERVRQALLQELLEGRLGLGQKLLSEEGLAEQYQVSRSSVREAVAALVTAGFLERRHGSGTYVVGLPGPRHVLDTTLSYTQMIADAGMEPGLRVLGLRRRPATLAEANDLGISPGDPVCEVRRLRTADDVAVVYSIDVLPERVVAEVPDSHFEGSLYSLLAQIGTPVASAHAVITPVKAEKWLARLLGVRAGSALVRVGEVDVTSAGLAVVVSTEWHVPGIFELRVNRRP